ncbi:intron-binding protein aquarius [Pelomyxa schiedti]|nr:intron-binding protein aquarius [Pelomyxa schiedti]
MDGSSSGFVPIASTEEVLTTFLICVLMGACLLLVFLLCRKRHADVYQPKTELFEGFAPPAGIGPLFYHLFVGQRDSAVLREQGLDALIYLCFNKGCMLFSFALCIEALAILTPVDVLGETSKPYFSSGSGSWGATPPQLHGVDVTSISNLEDGSLLLWVHLVSLFVNTALVWLLVLWLNKKYVSLSRNYKKSGDLHHFSVLLENVPLTWDSERLKEFLIPSFPDLVDVHRVVVRPLVDEIMDSRNQAYIAFERAQYEFEQLKKRPTRLVPSIKCCLCFIGTKVDSIEYYQEEVRRLEALLDPLFEEQAHLTNFTNFAFALFSTASSASLCHYQKQIINPDIIPRPLIVTQAPHPNDVVWHALLVTRGQMTTRIVGYIAMLSLMTILCAFLVVFTASLSSLSFLSNIESLSFLTVLQSGPLLIGLLQGFIPALITVLCISFVPVVLSMFDCKLGIRKKSDVAILGTMSCFILLVVSVIVVYIIAGSIFTDLYLVLYDILEYAQLFSRSIPLQATFFIDCIQIITICGPILSLSHLATLLRLWLAPKIFGCTPRDMKKLRHSRSMKWVSSYSRNLLVLAVGMLFSTISPMILPFTLIYFFFAHLEGQYLLRYIFVRKYESGGAMLQWLSHGTMLSLIFYQVTTLCILELKRFPVSTVGFILPLTTVPLWVYSHWYFRQHEPTLFLDELSAAGDDTILLDTPQFSIVKHESRLNYDSPSLHRNYIEAQPPTRSSSHNTHQEYAGNETPEGSAAPPETSTTTPTAGTSFTATTTAEAAVFGIYHDLMATTAAAPTAVSTTDTKRRTVTPSVAEILRDDLTKLSLEHWAPHVKSHPPFSAQIVEEIYQRELKAGCCSDSSLQRVMLLELSFYLESYLWPNWTPTASVAHIMSIIVMVNEKAREGATIWDTFLPEEKFLAFMKNVVELSKSPLEYSERIAYTLFLINCFQSLENKMIRQFCLRLTSVPLWLHVNKSRVRNELKTAPSTQKHWEMACEKYAGKNLNDFPETSFIPCIINQFLATLESTVTVPPNPHVLLYCERFVEFLIDLLGQMPTRRAFHLYFINAQIHVRCKLSELSRLLPKDSLFNKLVDSLCFYTWFEVNTFTGEALTIAEMGQAHCERIQAFQRVAFRYFPELRSAALSNIASVETRVSLLKHLKDLTPERLRLLAFHLHLVSEAPQPHETRSFLTEVIIYYLEKRISQLDKINEEPLYPSESLLWNEAIIPSINYTGLGCLALPKLNLQFLTLHDYLLRNYTLFQLESTYEIREDIESVVKRLNPRLGWNKLTELTGWSRMALPVREFRITRVSKPAIGETKPAEVVAEIRISLSDCRAAPHKEEWEAIRQHDVLFLLSIQSRIRPEDTPDPSLPFAQRWGVEVIRGCEVNEIIDERGNVVRDLEIISQEKRREGVSRTFRGSVYSGFNVLMRRKPKENNFKAVLETIRELMNSEFVVPEWLNDIFLGYGSADQEILIQKVEVMDFVDTFLSAEHVLACFPGKKVIFEGGIDQKEPPFKLTFPKDMEDTVIVTPYKTPSCGPYPQYIPKKNRVPFTPVQVAAIQSGLNEGLTMVVGPPGTGKTDVAVQIISNLYHTFPEQRTLLVTHSNQALNQLFEKIICLDVQEQHLLRLGHGERELETSKDFSRKGRVNQMLEMRLHNLAEVERLGTSLGISMELASVTCETAAHFFLLNVLSRWEKFLAVVQRLQSVPTAVRDQFPFMNFFSTAPQPLFVGVYEKDMETAQGCFRHLKRLFAEIEECRAFELLRSTFDRSNYLLTKQAKIIAMTCTHAALKRRDLVSMEFKYDNIVMEEAAQILEIETFIPMLLQKMDRESESSNRLKRVVLIGDHNQLPPVVKNVAFQKYGHLDQSLFTRFVRLGVRYHELDAQGRSRPEIAALYNWKYRNLGNLPFVLNNEEYRFANAGFAYDYQLINVNDYEGRGESEPVPHFFQNLGEAEYVVQCYMYMRLLGYPRERISILTTYNGQKHLLRDIVDRRCSKNPLIGDPHQVTTVDKFQGQQNDYILLSLVRTKTVGHIRDVRRLVVAMSRARLGLYVFCRKALFENCYELTKTFSLLAARPDSLQLVQEEAFPTQRQVTTTGTMFPVVDVVHMGQIVSTLMSLAVIQQQQIREAVIASRNAVNTPDKATTNTATPSHPMEEVHPQPPTTSTEKKDAVDTPMEDSTSKTEKETTTAPKGKDSS